MVTRASVLVAAAQPGRTESRGEASQEVLPALAWIRAWTWHPRAGRGGRGGGGWGGGGRWGRLTDPKGKASHVEWDAGGVGIGVVGTSLATAPALVLPRPGLW